MLFWLDMPLEYLAAAAALGLLALVVGALAIRSQRDDALLEVRRLVLGRLRLAAERRLPLPGALNALAEDLLLETRLPSGSWALRLFARLAQGPLPHRQTRQLSEQIAEVATLLQEGGLRSGLEAVPQAFPAPYPELIARAADEGTLLLLLAQLEREDDQAICDRKRVGAQLTYPTWVLCSALIPVLGLHTQLRQVLQRAFTSANLPNASLSWLPLAHAALAVVTPLVILALWASTWLVSPRDGRLRELAERLPWFRQLHAAGARARFAHTLQAALRAGVPLAEALGGASWQSESPRQARDAAARVAEGEALIPALRATGGVAASELLGLPERRGSELAALEQLAARARAERSARLSGLVRVAFPVALLLVSSLAAVSYWLPFWQLGQLHRGYLW